MIFVRKFYPYWNSNPKPNTRSKWIRHYLCMYMVCSLHHLTYSSSVLTSYLSDLTPVTMTLRKNNIPVHITQILETHFFALLFVKFSFFSFFLHLLFINTYLTWVPTYFFNYLFLDIFFFFFLTYSSTSKSLV